MEVSTLRYSGGIGLHGRAPLLRLQSDDRLIGLTRRGNTGAFEVLVARYESRLMAFCRHLLGSREDAEDVLQEVMTAAFNAILADDRPINVRPWLYRIARNRSLNHLRRTQAIGVDSMDHHYADHGTSTADRVHEREEFRLLVGDIHELPETQKTALVLREMDALSYEQIAEAMETTVPSVKSLLVRARVSLAEAAEARLLSCDEVRIELAEVAEGLQRRPSALVRRHLRSCKRCSSFRSELKKTNKALAALLPVGPLAMLHKLIFLHLGHGASAGSGATAAGAGSSAAGAGATAAGAGVAGAGALAGGGAMAGSSGLISASIGAFAGKAAAGLAAAALVTAGAVDADHPAVTHPHHPVTSAAAVVTPHPSIVASDQVVPSARSYAEPSSSAPPVHAHKKATKVAKATAAGKSQSAAATKTPASSSATAKTPAKTAATMKPAGAAPAGRTQTTNDPTVLQTDPSSTTTTTTSPSGPPTTATTTDPSSGSSSSGTSSSGTSSSGTSSSGTSGSSGSGSGTSGSGSSGSGSGGAGIGTSTGPVTVTGPGTTPTGPTQPVVPPTGTTTAGGSTTSTQPSTTTPTTIGGYLTQMSVFRAKAWRFHR